MYRYIAKMTVKSKLLILAICSLHCSQARAEYTFEQLKELSLPETYSSVEWKNLLHYDNEKSVINKESNFFLSSDGFKNPQAEYLATLKAITENIKQQDNHAICKYPARFDYILHSLNLKKQDFNLPICKDYQEYRKKVPIDSVSVVFAAESNRSPSSMMGHAFLKLQGTNEKGLKEHSFSYFAAFNIENSLQFYIDIITTGIDGAYILSPYKYKIDEYLIGEKRSLWEFDINLTTEEIERLKSHIWELKGHNIKYSLVSHNCNTAVVSILTTANPEFKTSNIKPFITPVEYLKELYNKQKIKKISIEPTEYMRKKIHKNGTKNILSANNSSRISIQYQSISPNYVLFQLSPAYQDIRDTNSAYHDELESKIGEIGLGYSFKKNKAFVESINILKMRSILDYTLEADYSKHFKLSLENDLSEESTNLKPTIEFGLGWGISDKMLSSYFLPKLGYRYNQYGNLYLAPEIGFISKIGKDIKIITSYETYINSQGNNRGYNGKYDFYIGYKVTNNQDIFVNYKYYSGTDNHNNLSVGFSYRF